MSESAKEDPFAAVARDPDAPTPDIAVPESSRPFLSFRLRNHWYAVPAVAVGEVVQFVPPVPVPGVPPFVGGVINLNGRIVVMLDLGALLGLGKSTGEPTQRCLILNADGHAVAARVDAVHGIVEVGASRLSSTNEVGGASQTFFEEGRVVTLLEIGKILAQAETQVSATTDGAWSS